jgi:hypothetical protein
MRPEGSNQSNRTVANRDSVRSTMRTSKRTLELFDPGTASQPTGPQNAENGLLGLGAEVDLGKRNTLIWQAWCLLTV